MNQYPVLFISLKDVEGLTFESALKMLKMVIANLCKIIEWLGNDDNVNPFDKKIFLKMQDASEDEELGEHQRE